MGKKALAIFILIFVVFCLEGCTDKEKVPIENKDGIGSSGYSGIEKKDNILYETIESIRGIFFTEMWGQNRTQNKIKDLIHGCSLISYRQADGLIINPLVVESYISKDTNDGNIIYEINLCKDMKYSDGSNITAIDYVFSLLFRNNQEVYDLGVLEDLTKENVYGDIRLINDYSFSVEIKREAIPYYYELEYLNIIPYPMEVIAPKAIIQEIDGTANIVGDFSTEILRETVDNEENGYRFMPKVTAGPYFISEVNKTDKYIVMKENPFYKKGTAKYGQEYSEIKLKTVDDISNENSNFIKKSDICGLGKIIFACENIPTDSKNIRKAIAYLMNAQKIAEEYTGNIDDCVYGDYSKSQWMFLENKEKLKSELNVYSNNLDKAIELIVEDGWILNSKGAKYQQGVDDYRYKKIGNSLKQLNITHLITTDSKISSLIIKNFSENAMMAGICYETINVPASVIYDNLNGLVPKREFNLINIAVDFESIYDPYFSYNTDRKYWGKYNVSYINDSGIEDAAKELRMVEPGNKEKYLLKWFEFQKIYNDILPELPLYSR